MSLLSPKYGSAPGASAPRRAESPFCAPVRGMTNNMTVERPRGVLHRIDRQLTGAGVDLCHIELFRCPGCRLQCQLMCPTCVSTYFRLNRLREAYRSWFLKKADVCQKIGRELEPQMNLTADLHAKQRSVVDLRKRIHDAKDSIGRLKRRLALTEVRTNKCGKNVKTLEKKAVSHANRIENLARENEKYRSALLSKQQEYLGFYARLFSHYFSIERHVKDRRAKDTGKGKTVQQWPPVKNYYFTVNRCTVDDHSDYKRLLSELLEGSSSLFLEKQSRHAFSALLYTVGFVNTMASFLDLRLPYSLSLQDFVTCTHWTQDLFLTDIFRLNVNVLAVCAAFGLPHEVLKLNQPFQNLFSLVTALKQNTFSTIRGRIDEHMKHQIIEGFHHFNWEQRQDRLEVDNIEEDWVNVGYTSK